eukprot:SAG22_NODE_2051_length_3077_cov_41.063465_1_plen_84_part_00
MEHEGPMRPVVCRQYGLSTGCWQVQGRRLPNVCACMCRRAASRRISARVWSMVPAEFPLAQPRDAGPACRDSKVAVHTHTHTR